MGIGRSVTNNGRSKTIIGRSYYGFLLLNAFLKKNKINGNFQLLENKKYRQII